MSGFFALRLEPLLPLIRGVDVNGFKFLYELLAVSRGRLSTAEVPLTFQPRTYGTVSYTHLTLPTTPYV